MVSLFSDYGMYWFTCLVLAAGSAIVEHQLKVFYHHCAQLQHAKYMIGKEVKTINIQTTKASTTVSAH